MQEYDFYNMVHSEALWRLERDLWHADTSFYDETLANDAVMIFPEPTGILSRQEILASLSQDDRWKNVNFHDKHTIQVDDDVVQLVYRAEAERTDDSSYQTYITTTYHRAGKSWEIVSHQQTPKTM